MSTAKKSSTPTVTTAAKRPVQTKTFLEKLKTALSIFDDEISSLGEQRTTAYETFITTYQTAFADIWPKIQTANVTTLLGSVTDTELRALKRLSEQLCPDPKPTLLKEKRDVPTSDAILGGLVSKIPQQKLPGKEACSLIADIFSDLAEAHKFSARAAKGLAEITSLVSPEQLTLILAAAVPLTLQLVLPPGQISPLSAPPPPPETSTTPTGRQEMINYCKKQILPNHLSDAFDKCEPRSPTRVLAAAIFSTLEKHLFDTTTPRAEVAANFSITPAQLHKAVTGVDYRSGPHVYTKKRKTTDAPTTSGETSKTTPAPSSTPSPVKQTPQPDESSEDSGPDPPAKETHSADTLPSDSSDSLPDVVFK